MHPCSLYIHIPWCIQKCPYCDFNSHKSPSDLPEIQYVQALIADLDADLTRFAKRTIHSIFIGGGTPSLLSARAYDLLFNEIQKRLDWSPEIEITLEANPGTVEQQRFRDYRSLGINRLSIGIQSFNPVHLKALGRIHDEKQASLAIESARLAGFENINLDLMHGLPKQSIEEGLTDLNTAIAHQPEHLSWYQLTIEPNTIFYKKRPTLPSEDDCCTLEETGFALLQQHGFHRYEISAFCRDNKPSAHNLNYWQFGDYFGIGAGAHGKLTTPDGTITVRTQKHRQPTDYLNPDKAFLSNLETLSAQDLIFEFMLNATRLQKPIPMALFGERTGLNSEQLLPLLRIAQEKKLVTLHDDMWQVTHLGRQYSNDLQALFLRE